MVATTRILTVHSGQSHSPSQPPTAVGAVWTGLGTAQGQGRACVICTDSLPTDRQARRASAAVMVGRDPAGSPVFACPGVCATRASSLATVHASTRVVGGGGRR
jgi:hypothetical protein